MVSLPDWPQPKWQRHIDLGLARIETLLERLDNPHLSLPPVVHVAGTNGKGSTIAFMRSMLESAGYKVHVYSSPHLLSFNERIRLSGQLIDDAYLQDVVERTRAKAEDLNVTFFEGTTAFAFLAFAEVDADILLLETGLGGRLDATNVVPNPVLTVFTPISEDHMEYLGNNLTSIAQEKAAIMKPNCKAVSAMQYEESMAQLVFTSESLSVPLFAHGFDWQVTKTEQGFCYEEQQGQLLLPTPNLIGDHQLMNAATAVASIRMLSDFTVSEEAIRKGLVTVHWPGRLQQITARQLTRLLPDDSDIWVDGGHNKQAGHILANWLAKQSKMPTYMIAGMTKGKDAKSFFAPLAPYISRLYGLRVDVEPLAMHEDAVVEAASASGLDAVVTDNIEAALITIQQEVTSPVRVIIAGSLFLVASTLSKGV